MSVKGYVIVFQEVHEGAHGEGDGGAACHQPEVAGEVGRAIRGGGGGAEEGGGGKGDREDQRPHGEGGVEGGQVDCGDPEEGQEGEGRGRGEAAGGGDRHVPGRGEEDDREGEGGHETGGAEAVEPETVHTPEGEQAYEQGEDDDAQAPAALYGGLRGDATQEPGGEQAHGHRASVDHTLCHFLDLRRGPPVDFGVHHTGPV